MAIHTIVCCCGSGLGSSLILSMNVERALKALGITGVNVEHTSLSEVNEKSGELFVVGKDLKPQIDSWHCEKIYLNELMNKTELETKLKEAFQL